LKKDKNSRFEYINGVYCITVVNEQLHRHVNDDCKPPSSSNHSTLLLMGIVLIVIVGIILDKSKPRE